MNRAKEKYLERKAKRLARRNKAREEGRIRAAHRLREEREQRDGRRRETVRLLAKQQEQYRKVMMAEQRAMRQVVGRKSR